MLHVRPSHAPVTAGSRQIYVKAYRFSPSVFHQMPIRPTSAYVRGVAMSQFRIALRMFAFASFFPTVVNADPVTFTYRIDIAQRCLPLNAFRFRRPSSSG